MNSPLIKLIKASVLGFPWSDYGLDNVAEVDSDDWADDLAVEIAVAITDRVEVDLS